MSQCFKYQLYLVENIEIIICKLLQMTIKIETLNKVVD